MINTVSLIQLASAIEAEYIGNDENIQSSVSIDTRTLKKGQIFVAINGQYNDGHDYIDKALDLGAAACISEKALPGKKNILLVKNTRQALLQLGRFYRNRFKGLVTGVTGSCGKTSVKEMLASVLGLCGHTLFTGGNYNNAIGVPLTLSRLTDQYQFAVIEMGTSSPGEIGVLAQIVRPQIAIITNAEAAHIEKLKSVEGVAIEKGTIIEGVATEGSVVLNKGSPFFAYWSLLAEKQNISIISFDLNNKTADVYASDFRHSEKGIQFNLHFLGQRFPVNLNFYGKHQVANACAATAAALAAGISPENIIKGLSLAKPYQRRGQQFTGINNATIIDESYNANPASVRASIDMLSEFSGMCIFVLGDMTELGNQAIRAHQQMGEYALKCGIDRLVTYGKTSIHATKAFDKNALHFDHKADLTQYLRSCLTEDTTVLIKGSNSMKMNEIVDACLNTAKACDQETQRSI